MNLRSRIKKFTRDKKAVFGLTSVQAFFAIILGVALLAYVMIVIFGTLSATTNTLIPQVSTSVVNEAGFINNTGFTLTKVTSDGFNGATISSIINTTSGVVINSANYTLTAAGVLKNATTITWPTVSINYTYTANAAGATSGNAILQNTSVGITSFFGAINPVYAILAILVIILVLVVLVRVVTGGVASQRSSSVPL